MTQVRSKNSCAKAARISPQTHCAANMAASCVVTFATRFVHMAHKRCCGLCADFFPPPTSRSCPCDQVLPVAMVPGDRVQHGMRHGLQHDCWGHADVEPTRTSIRLATPAPCKLGRRASFFLLPSFSQQRLLCLFFYYITAAGPRGPTRMVARWRVAMASKHKCARVWAAMAAAPAAKPSR